jgi:hypothetical protein
MVTLNQNARIVSPPQDFRNAAMATRACVTANFPSSERALSRCRLFGRGLKQQARHSFLNVTHDIWQHDKNIIK